MPELRITQKSGDFSNIDGLPGTVITAYDDVNINAVIQNYLDLNGYISSTVSTAAANITGISDDSPATLTMGQTPKSGVSGLVSRSDHAHGMPAFGPIIPQLLFGLGFTDGFSDKVARADHAHGTPTGAAAFTPTGTVNNSRNKMVRYITASAGTKDGVGQNLDNLVSSGTGVTRVADSQAYGGYAIRAVAASTPDSTVFMDGPFYGSDTNDFVTSPGLQAGNYRVTVYCKVSSVASPLPAVAFDAHCATAGIVQNDGTAYTFNAADLSTGYVGASFPMVLLGDTRATNGLEIRAYFRTAAGADVRISHVQIELFEGLVAAEVTTSFIANLAVTDAKINTLTVAKLTTGTLTADVTQSGIIRTGPDTGARVLINALGIYGYTTSGTGFPSFSLTNAGALTLTGTVNATGGSFSGSITASGTITGGTISGAQFTNGSNFSVTPTGALTASSATITGTINATGGTFSGTVNVSGTLSGGTITGANVTAATLQTASSGARIVINSSNADTIQFYNSSGSLMTSSIVGFSTTSGDSLFYYGTHGFRNMTVGTAGLGTSFTVRANCSWTSASILNGDLNGAAQYSGSYYYHPVLNPISFPVTSVNGQTGSVSIAAGVSSVNGSSGDVLVNQIMAAAGSSNYHQVGNDGSSERIYTPNTATAVFRVTNGKALNCGITGSVDKAFIIDHPNPAKSNLFLHHSCLEGPTADVYYRGEGRLTFFHDPTSEGANHDETVRTAGHGAATVTLPDYFEYIAREEGRTVTVTPILGCDDDCEFGLHEEDYGVLVAPTLAVTRVENGQFVVRTTAGYNHGCASFFWEVKAVRRDVPLYDAEPSKTEYSVRGDGPYTYLVPN